MKKHEVQPGQSLFDIAVIRYGNVSGITWLLADNPILKGPTDRIYPGQMLNIRASAISVRQKVYLEDFPIIATISAADMPEGIGYWRLDEYVITGEIPDLAFVPELMGYEPELGLYRVFFAINLEGQFTVNFTNENNELVRTYDYYFFPNQQTGFGLFAPGKYNIQIATISTQITIVE